MLATRGIPRTVIAALLCAVFSLPASGQVVTFPDANLETLVRWALYLPSGYAITQADMLRLKTVDDFGSYLPVGDLTGLEYALNLNRLMLASRGTVSDLTPLTGLTRLEGLGLNGGNLPNLNALSGMTSLRGVAFASAGIQDISGLSGLTGLEDISLAENPVSDISALSGMTNLWYLYLSGSQVSDLSPLAGLTGLHQLHLSHNLVGDISPLRGMTGMSYLSLSDNAIVDLEPLCGIPGLEQLWAGDNLVSDMSPLAGLSSLRTLSLAGNVITSIPNLTGMHAMLNLILPYNQIADISGMEGLRNNDELWVYLAYNRISDISVFADFTNLQLLDLTGNPLNNEAYSMYIPLILANNPEVRLSYDPIAEPGCLGVFLAGALGVAFRFRPRGLMSKGRRDPYPTNVIERTST